MAPEEFAVHVENAPRAGLLVKIVHVLRAQEKTLVQSLLESSEGKMAGIWLSRGCHFAPHRIEIPDEAWIAPPGVRRSDFFDSIIAPQSADVAKSGNAAFSADAGTGENKNAVGGRDDES